MGTKMRGFAADFNSDFACGAVSFLVTNRKFQQDVIKKYYWQDATS